MTTYLIFNMVFCFVSKVSILFWCKHWIFWVRFFFVICYHLVHLNGIWMSICYSFTFPFIFWYDCVGCIDKSASNMSYMCCWPYVLSPIPTLNVACYFTFTLYSIDLYVWIFNYISGGGVIDWHTILCFVVE